MAKKNPVFLCIPECSLSYSKIVQTSGMTKKNPVFLFIPECRLSIPIMPRATWTKCMALLACAS